MKRRTRCATCKKKGHWKKECPDKDKDKNKDKKPRKSGNGGGGASSGAGFFAFARDWQAGPDGHVVSVRASLGSCLMAAPGSEPKAPSQTPAPWRAICAKWDHEDEEETDFPEKDATSERQEAEGAEIGQGVVDTGCTKMIAGSRTITQLLRHLESTYGLTGQVVPANTIFRFGGGDQKRARWAVILPAGIGGHCCVLKISGVTGDAPLLLSRGLLFFFEGRSGCRQGPLEDTCLG